MSALRRFWFVKRSTCAELSASAPDASASGLTPKNVWPVFVLLGAGMALSIVWAVAEVLYFRHMFAKVQALQSNARQQFRTLKCGGWGGGIPLRAGWWLAWWWGPAGWWWGALLAAGVRRDSPLGCLVAGASVQMTSVHTLSPWLPPRTAGTCAPQPLATPTAAGQASAPPPPAACGGGAAANLHPRPRQGCRPQGVTRWRREPTEWKGPRRATHTARPRLRRSRDRPQRGRTAAASWRPAATRMRTLYVRLGVRPLWPSHSQRYLDSRRHARRRQARAKRQACVGPGVTVAPRPMQKGACLPRAAARPPLRAGRACCCSRRRPSRARGRRRLARCSVSSGPTSTWVRRPLMRAPQGVAPSRVEAAGAANRLRGVMRPCSPLRAGDGWRVRKQSDAAAAARCCPVHCSPANRSAVHSAGLWPRT